jgi:hypothetical protein
LEPQYGDQESDILGLKRHYGQKRGQCRISNDGLSILVAELAWSPRGQNWEEYRQRLAAHGKRMEAMGINFFKSPDVDWE